MCNMLHDETSPVKVISTCFSVASLVGLLLHQAHTHLFKYVLKIRLISDFISSV